MDDRRAMVYGLSSTVCFAGVVATEGSVESLRGRNSAFEPREAGMQVEGLFESLLNQSFGSKL